MCFISDIVVYLLISQILVVVSSENDSNPEIFNNTEKYVKTQFLNGTEEDVRKLTLYQSSVEILEADNFTRFKDSLVHLHLVELYGLKFIQKNTFNKLSRLQSLYLSRVPKLDTLSLDILENDLVGLKYLHVVLTGIRNVPRLRRISEPIMEIVDFERNSIQIIESNRVVVRANQVIFDHNEITTVESWAFNGSEISKISLKGNVKLSVLSKHAFDGIKSLRVLDLSETSISSVPTNGLKDLETLIIQRTYSLKTIPSIYDFHNLKEADLTFSFHCCAFHLPKRHNPEKYALHKTYVEKMKKTCPEFSSAPSAGFSRSKKDPEDDTSDDEEWHGRRKRQVFMKTLLTEPSLNKTMIAFCGNFSLRQDLVKCGPVPNAFNPCEDIMGYKWLRYSVWFVVLTGLCGNICVLMVILGKHAELTVQNLLICNLAFSDLCMAVFLLMLAVEDLISEGVYFNYAYDWQRGVGCKVAGFVSIFSSQLSIFILTLVTVERWFTIKRALYTNRLTIRKTAVIIFFGWLNASVMASLPLFGISSYSAASLCLPMRIETVVDTAYVLFLLFTSFAAFVTICVCYYQIYFSLSYETRHKDGEYVLARKMTILVATDFLCWAPITFFALTAVVGFPLIDITNSKILLVFFYPLNSCANPFLYAILTTNFKRDLVYLLSKIGICRKAARKYKLIYYHPKGNSEHPIPRPLTSQTSV